MNPPGSGRSLFDRAYALASRAERLLSDLRHHDSALWREAFRAGVSYAPEPFVRYSPLAFGLLFGAAMGDMRERVLASLRRSREPPLS